MEMKKAEEDKPNKEVIKAEALDRVEDALNESSFMILRQMIKEEHKGKNLMF